MIYIGIDPGKKGGLAAIENNKLIAVIPYLQTAKILEFLSTNKVEFGIIERVHAFPQQGVVSQFSFGENYGWWKGVLTALRIPYLETLPKVWQKLFSLPSDKTERKKKLHETAIKLFPDVDIKLDLADAVLIAFYANTMFNKQGETL